MTIHWRWVLAAAVLVAVFILVLLSVTQVWDALCATYLSEFCEAL